MIVVTGASGKLGRAVVEGLLGRVPSDRIVAVTRDIGNASDLAARGVAVRTGDFADAQGLERAFAGAGRALVVSADKLGDEAWRLHGNAIGAARKAGVGRLFYTSHMGARAGSPFLPADQHAATEADLAAAGMACTALRHGFYAESCLQMVGASLRTGELQVPEDGPVGWTARADLAEADAILLAGDVRWDGISPPLTARDAVTMADIATVASEVTGRLVRHTVVTDAEWRDAKVAAGMPALHADMLLGVFRAARQGHFATTDPTLERLLGRPPRTMRDVLAAWLSPSHDPHAQDAIA